MIRQGDNVYERLQSGLPNRAKKIGYFKENEFIPISQLGKVDNTEDLDVLE